jgi:hypothetical protein
MKKTIFRKKDGKSITISQDISLYPKENISLTLKTPRDELKAFTEGINGTKVLYKEDYYRYLWLRLRTYERTCKES